MPGFTAEGDRVAEAVCRAASSARGRLLLVGMAALLVAGGTGLVYATGGTQRAWPHLLYVPVLLMAGGFGPVGGLVAGLVAGLAVGPFMPLDRYDGVPQEPLNWIYRTGFFMLTGGVAGGLNELLRRQVGAAQRLRDRFSALVEHAPDVILVTDDEGQVRYASPSLGAMLGRTPDAVAGQPFADLVHPHDRTRAASLVGTVRRGTTQCELRMHHGDGSWRLIELVASCLPDDPDLGGLILNARDVTQRRAMEAELRHQAWHDPTTGLPNRHRLTEVLRENLAGRNGSSDGEVAVLLIGLDRFRVISETLGPDTSDRIIRSVALRLQRLLRPGDLLARHESGEFAVVCRELRGARAVHEIAERLLEAFREPFLLVTGELHVRASIGAAMAAATDGDAGRLLHDAYAALRMAASGRRGRVQLFQPAWREEAEVTLSTENALHGALKRGELELHYQPVVDLRTGRPVSVEGLLRWRHPRLGIVAPGDFIPIAEQTGMIIPIGRWVLHEACTQLATWRRELDLPDLQMAVNLSARQLDTADVAEDVRAALRSAGLPPESLILELTETTLFENTQHTLEALIALHGLGVGLAVDDFGTGYSSLGYLKRLPVDVLKIDRLFVGTLHDDDNDEAIVSAIIGLAHSLGLVTVAEGVELPDHASQLIGLGCEQAQGNLYAKALPPGQAAAVLADLGTRPAAAPRRTLRASDGNGFARLADQ
jgi:diguanylate cyclase (GGDEF)-like protein/PAS domain S-box-containing protein